MNAPQLVAIMNASQLVAIMNAPQLVAIMIVHTLRGNTLPW